jgi:hypothetical protein
VPLTHGTAQRFEFKVPAGAPESVAFAVRRGNAIAWSSWARADHGFVVETWLVPGDYEVLVTEKGRHGSASFTVGKEPGAPIVVFLH